MSSNNCRISGTLRAHPGVTIKQIKAAFEPLKGQFRGQDGEEPYELDDDGTLFISRNVYGEGGYRNDDVLEVCACLAPLVQAGHVEFIDYDSGSEEGVVTPYFIGITPADRDRAQLEYALEEVEDHLTEVLGRDGFAKTREFVRALPLKVDDDSDAVSDEPARGRRP